MLLFSRQVLMCQIIRKMQQDLHPPTMPSKPSHRFENNNPCSIF